MELGGRSGETSTDTTTGLLIVLACRNGLTAPREKILWGGVSFRGPAKAVQNHVPFWFGSPHFTAAGDSLRDGSGTSIGALLAPALLARLVKRDRDAF